MRNLIAADLFCGAGGTSQGAEATGAAKVVFAVNHWPIAIETHSANFPHCKHVCARIDQVQPGEVEKLDLLFASPECTHHSRARGGKPMVDQKRAMAWDVLKWIDYHRPSFGVVENVTEFEQWGPLGDDGRPLASKVGSAFHAWVKAIESFNYRVEWRRLNAADFGAATSRQRLFVIFRKGNRAIDWPDPTHCRRPGGQLPGMELQPWVPAWQIIDWSIPCPSIFARKRPLADKTLLRIEAGLRRFCSPHIVKLRGTGTVSSINRPLPTVTAGGKHEGLAVPFMAMWDQQGAGSNRIKSIEEPMPTMVTKANTGLAVPFMVPRHGERDGQEPRTHDIDRPTPTITTSNAPGQAVPFFTAYHNGPDGSQRNYPVSGSLPTLDTSNRYGIVAPYMIDVNHGDARHSNGRSYPVDAPLGTVTGHNGKALCIPFLTGYYGTGGSQWHSLDKPLATISTRDRHALVAAILPAEPSQVQAHRGRSEAMDKLLDTMAELGVADVGFRMLVNAELAAATGFPSDYIFCGNTGQVTKQIGNAVPPAFGSAITKALAG